MYQAKHVRRETSHQDFARCADAWPGSATRAAATWGSSAVAHVLREGLELPAGVTLLVGENGTGAAPASVENCPVTPIAARTPARSRRTSKPATRISPSSVASSVERMLTTVVLPAPLGPRSA